MPRSLSILLLLASCTRGGAASVEPADAERPDAAEHQGPAMAGHHRPHDLAHSFDDAEAWAQHFDDPQRDAWQRPDAVIEALGLPPNAVVADLGAGTGYFTVRLARAIPKGRVLAIDVEPAMVRHLQERAASEGLDNIVATRNTATDPGLTETVDVVFMCNVAHHIADRVSFFRSVVQQLDDDGRVVIVDFRPDAPEGTPGPPPRHRLPIDRLTRELGEAGLELVSRDITTLPYQYILSYRRRS
jgi:SAM-dependent methyltransferase